MKNGGRYWKPLPNRQSKGQDVEDPLETANVLPISITSFPGIKITPDKKAAR
jgi:hypothetical protein